MNRDVASFLNSGDFPARVLMQRFNFPIVSDDDREAAGIAKLRRLAHRAPSVELAAFGCGRGVRRSHAEFPLGLRRDSLRNAAW